MGQLDEDLNQSNTNHQPEKGVAPTEVDKITYNGGVSADKVKQRE